MNFQSIVVIGYLTECTQIVSNHSVRFVFAVKLSIFCSPIFFFSRLVFTRLHHRLSLLKSLWFSCLYQYFNISSNWWLIFFFFSHFVFVFLYFGDSVWNWKSFAFTWLCGLHRLKKKNGKSLSKKRYWNIKQINVSSPISSIISHIDQYTHMRT